MLLSSVTSLTRKRGDLVNRCVSLIMSEDSEADGEKNKGVDWSPCQYDLHDD